MKTYLLRNANPVQPQTPARRTRSQSRPGVVAAEVSSPSPVTPKDPVLCIGLDVHTDSIAVSLAPSDSPEVRRYGIIGGAHDDVLKRARKLSTAHPGTLLRFCYEAGPHGYPLCRCLQSHGYNCILVAPSKVPRQPGDRKEVNGKDIF